MEREEYQKLEKYLKSYLSAEEEARMYSEKYCMIMEQGKAVKALVMSSAPASCSGPSDLSAYSTKVDDVKRQMMQSWDIANQRLLDIDRLISRLDSWEEKSILKSVYIMGYDLKFLQKIGRSYSKVKRLHHDGMEHLKKLLDSDSTLCDGWQQVSTRNTEELMTELENRTTANAAEFSKDELDIICYALQLYIDSQPMAAGEEQMSSGWD